jgi:DNA-directed RNA polymerase beta' subunit
MLYKELAYDRVVSHVRGIQFCVLSEQEIRRRSVCEVTENQTFQGNEPVANGLFDTRMGVIDNSRVCATCQQRNTFCPGHFGHITMVRPVFYVQFYDIVRKLLQCVCFRCSKCLISMDAPDVRAVLSRKGLSHQKRWEAMSKLCQRVKRCGQDTHDGCGAKKPDKVLKTDDMRIKMQWRDVEPSAVVAEVVGGTEEDAAAGSSGMREQIFTAEDVIRILRRISDVDSEALGFSAEYNRPEWMVCTVLPVPPPAVRPSVRQETGQRQEDDLTHKLADIVKYNNMLKDKIAKGSSFETIQNFSNLVQYHVATLIDNSMPSMYPSKDRAGRTFRSLCERLKHKEGRIRGNLMGKRVDFSARTVITPDPNLSIDELGVPLKIAMNLTFPEVVNSHNMEELRMLVMTGPDAYPGAKHVRKTHDGNRTIRLKGYPDPGSIVLEVGDVVERHLKNGDYVLFNRQPSLHKMSMMAHRVRVMEYNTFRLNVCVCACYNADFDGDEMNMHVPQSLQTHYELKELAAVPLHVMSPRYSKPIITIVQDVALGVFRITQGDVRVSQRQLFNLVCSNPMMDPTLLPPPVETGRWSGRQALSTVLPPSISVRMASGDKDKDAPDYRPDDDEVVIDNGIIKQGVLNTSVYSKESRGLVHATYNTLGPSAVTAMLNGTQKLICDWLVLSGFSVGISDLVVAPDTVVAMRGMLDNAKAEVYKLLHKVHAGAFENVSTKSDADYLEDQIGAALHKGSEAAGKSGRAGFNAENNRMLNMIQSGSKGKTVNFTQMVACLGYQAIDNKRVPDGFDHRTLPHYTKYDDGPESRGFVEHSFIDGLSPHEFFFHSMAGRIGLIDTAVRSVTWETPIVVTEGGKPKYVRIGEWIDAHLADPQQKALIQHFPEDRNLELLELPSAVFIPTVDADGRVTWGAMTAVTRHDPGERLYKVVTQGGREVTVAESKSLLVWDAETKKFVPKDSPDVKVGDFMPVTMSLPQPPTVVTFVDMADFLRKTEHVYGTDFNTATRLVMGLFEDGSLVVDDVDVACDASAPPRMVEEAQGGKFHIPRGWWAANNGKAFTLPYVKKSLLTRVLSGRSETENVKDGFVYPYQATRCHGGVPDRCVDGFGGVPDVCEQVDDANIGCIPDRFELDEENGIFVGLFLADGHTCEKSGVVGISKNDVVVRDFAKAWFEKRGFMTCLQDHSTDMGTSITLVGYSTLLARFLDRFVGHGARNKHVPDVAYAAPRVFVRGLLNGYFSGDGTVGPGYIGSSSSSKRLTEGISMLCTSLGVFAKISVTTQHRNNLGTADIAPLHNISVRAQWGTTLAHELGNIVHPVKDAALKATKFADKHVNYLGQNDVVLDPIKSIEVLGVEAHPKLYDVTVPSTLNFVLANGLGTRDTSETGYIQRKLVKAMEDCKIQHDLTVRNASGHIVQFLYGEDGMDAVKLEFQKLPYLTSTPALMRGPYLLSAAKELRGYARDELVDAMDSDEAAWRPRLNQHFEQLLDDRRAVIMGLCGGLSDDRPVVYPVNIGRLVMSTADLYANVGCAALSDLDPVYVVDRVDELCASLKIGMEDTSPGPGWMSVLLRCFLSPKVLIIKHRLNRLGFDRVIAQVRTGFYAAIAAPSEMVGIVAAQSIGEPTTQLSVASSARVLIAALGGSVFNGEIGPFIDGLLEKHAGRVIDLGHSSVVLDLEPEDELISIVGVSDEEKTSWKRISQVSRHPANGGLVRIHTMSGKTTCATLSHSFLRRTESGIVPVKGSELKVGDRVPVASFIPALADARTSLRIGNADYELTRQLGWFFGAFLADGYVFGGTVSVSKVIPEYQDKLREVVLSVFGATVKTREYQGTGTLNGRDMSKYPKPDNIFSHAELAEFLTSNGMCGSHTKRVPAWMYASNADFVRGVIGGYFDGDGNVSDILGKQMIRSASVSEGLTEDFVLLLAYVGIFASKCREMHIKEAGRNDLHTIQISRKHARRFKDEVGLVVLSKATALDNVIAYVEREDAKEAVEVEEEAEAVDEAEGADGAEPAKKKKKAEKSVKDEIDMIPELGPTLAFLGKALEIDGHSRTFRRFNKAAIGRRTLTKYIARFEAIVEGIPTYEDMKERILAIDACLTASSPAKMISLEPDIGAMVASCGLELKVGGRKMRTWRTKPLIKRSKLDEYVHGFVAANEARRAALPETLTGIEEKLAILRQAADADVVWDKIVKIDLLEDPKEFVYDFTVPGNDSFMVDCGVLVHNTLNSVVHDTEMLFKVDGKLQRTTIGDFVEGRIAGEEASGFRQGAASVACKEQEAAVEKGALLDAQTLGRQDTHYNATRRAKRALEVAEEDMVAKVTKEGQAASKSRLEHHPKDTTLAWLKDGGDEGEIPSGVEVLSCDETGKISWKEVTAVTRHPVVNKDGSDTLIKVTTRSGRSVTATKGKSFLMRRDNKIVQVDGENLEVGQHLPVSTVLPFSDDGEQFLDLSIFLPKTEFTFGSEVHKALAFKDEHHWWTKHSGVDFVVPHSRSDDLLEAYRDVAFTAGIVYPKKCTRTTSQLPERLPLDENFGFFLGAFLADGCIASKNDPEYRRRITDFCDRYSIGWHFTSREVNDGLSESVIIHSTLLTQLMLRMCGKLAHNKRFPAELLSADKAFLAAVLGGYFSGDGTVDKDGHSLSASSVSNGLLQDMRQILLRFGVTSCIKTAGTRKKESHYFINVLRISCKNIARFGSAVKLLTDKQQRLDAAMCRDVMYDHGKFDIIPDVVLKSGRVTVHRDSISELMEKTEDPADRAVLEAVAAEEIMYDEIVSIEEVPNPKPHVYDLTVRDTRNFNTYSGLAQRDTFHLAGAATANTVTSGVPRMNELMRMSRNIKTPAMTIRLKREWATSMERASEVMSDVQTTCFRHLVKSSSVYYDPSDTETEIEEDKEMMRFYREFGTLDRMGCEARASPWLLRFEFERDKMLDLKITMMDLEHVLTKFYADTVTCVFSDDNADKLVCRLRLATTKDDDGSSSDLLTEIKALEQSIIESSVVKGVKGIHKAVLSRPNTGLQKYDPVSDVFVTNDEWTIATAGSNMMEVMRNDYVDYTRTTTNDVVEVYNVLGIEAARAVLIDELRNVLGDLPLDHRHLSLLTDTMSNRGFLMSIDRHGINHRGELGPLAKCSFEQTTDMLIKAGVFAERDRINGVSANIMLGQVAPCGTGDCEVLIDGERLARVSHPVPLELGMPVSTNNNNKGFFRQQPGQKPGGNNNNNNNNNNNESRGAALPALGLPEDMEKKPVASKVADELEIV